MSLMLEGKVALVTGGASGIGRAISQTYAREGAAVAVVDVNDEQGAECVELIRSAGGRVIYIHADVADEQQVKAMVERTVKELGGLDAACNNAAVSRGSGPIHQYSREIFDHTLEMCLTNTWLCMKYEIEAMLAAGGGAIVNISSNSSLKGHAFNSAYAAAKGAVNILTKSSAAEYGTKGIRINAVSPGVIRTPGLERHFKEQPQVVEHLMNAAVMKRLGEPVEIAEAVVFLSSSRASFITGQLLSVDGGGAVK